MGRDDEIIELRARLLLLEESLADARARLDALEAAEPIAELPEVVVQDIVAVAKTEAVRPTAPATPPPLPEPAPLAAAAAPPPLPWERGDIKTTPAPLTLDKEAARPALEEKAPAPRQKPSPWKPEPAHPRRRFGPPEGMDLETALGTWWLPRIGIVILSVGIVFLLTWAGNKLFSGWMRPYLQVAGGYAVCAGLLIAAKRMEESARNYARVLASGGFALSYFTTFAAHFVVRPAVIASESLTGLLLFAVVLAWGVVAQRRKSPMLGLGVTLLGHLTIFLSLKAADTGGAFSTATLLLFSLMSAFFLVKNRWYSAGAAGMICSYLNLAVLLDNQVFVSHAMGTASAVALLAVVYAVFALAELFAPEELRRRDLRLSMRSAYVAANTFCALGLAWLLWNDAGGPLPGIHVLYGGAGLVVLVIARTYYHARHGDPLYNIYQIKGLSLITIAFGKYLSGEQFAVTLAVESLLLLLNASVTGFVVSRVFSILCAGLSAGVTLAQLWYRPYLQPLPDGWEWAFWITFSLLHATGVAYQRVNWRTRGLDTATAPVWLRPVLTTLDLTTEPPAVRHWGLKLAPSVTISLWPLYFSALAFLPWLALIPLTLQGAYPMIALLLLGVAAAVLRAWQISRALLVGATAYLYATWILASALVHETIYYENALYSAVCLLALSEIARLTASRSPGLWPALFWRPRGSAHWIAFLAAAPLFDGIHWAVRGDNPQFRYILADVPTDHFALALAGVAAGFAVYTAITNAVFWQTTLIVATLALLPTIERLANLSVPIDLAQVLIILSFAVCALIGQLRWFSGRPGTRRFRQLPIALWLASLLWAVLFIHAWALPEPRPAFVLPAVALAGLLLAYRFDARVFSPWPIASLGIATYILTVSSEFPHDIYWKFDLLAAIVVMFGADRLMRARGAWEALRLNEVGIIFALGASLLVVDEIVQGPLAVSVGFLVLVGYLVYAGGRGLLMVLGAGAIIAIVATVLSVQGEITDNSLYPLLGPIATTGAALAFWAVAEWGLRTRGTSDNQRGIANLLALLVCGLLLCMLSQIDALANFYLTIAWTLAAVAMMAAGAYSGQAFYRYGALATFGIVTLRAALWDTRNLDLLARTMSWMLLGIVLLVIAYGYIRARGKKE